ncbi:RING/U-box superfamily protein [Trifolium repens]|nr:RING/U-box superfamily protein [Trifolium repens]
MSSLNLNEPPHVIASEDHNDDLIEISRRAFLEGSGNSRSTRRRVEIDLNIENQDNSTSFLPDGTLINPKVDVNINFDPNMEKEASEPKSEFHCPICMDLLVEEMSTRCGHIFCKKCIKKAISSQGAKCPTCRKKVTSAQLIRVFLSSSN